MLDFEPMAVYLSHDIFYDIMKILQINWNFIQQIKDSIHERIFIYFFIVVLQNLASSNNL
jgi:hypothetical protein